MITDNDNNDNDDDNDNNDNDNNDDNNGNNNNDDNDGNDDDDDDDMAMMTRMVTMRTIMKTTMIMMTSNDGNATYLFLLSLWKIMENRGFFFCHVIDYELISFLLTTNYLLKLIQNVSMLN